MKKETRNANENLEDKIVSRISQKENFVLSLFVLEKTNLFSKEFIKLKNSIDKCLKRIYK